MENRFSCNDGKWLNLRSMNMCVQAEPAREDDLWPVWGQKRQAEKGAGSSHLWSVLWVSSCTLDCPLLPGNQLITNQYVIIKVKLHPGLCMVVIYYVVGFWHTPRNLVEMIDQLLVTNQFSEQSFQSIVEPYVVFCICVICSGLWGKPSAPSLPSWPELLPQESPDLWWQNDWLAQPPAGCWLHPRWGHAVLRCCLGFRLNDILILVKKWMHAALVWSSQDMLLLYVC